MSRPPRPWGEDAVTSLLLEYRAWLRASGFSPQTVRARMMFARARWDEWGTWQVEPDQVAELLERFSGWTRRTYDSHLRSLFAWLVETEQLEVDPMARMRRPKQPRPSPRPLTDEECQRALDAATGNTRAYLILGMYAGLRVHEIAKIRGEDVTEHRLRVAGKGGVVATLPTHPEIWALAQQYPREGYWFPSAFTRKRPGQPITPASVANTVTTLFRSLGIEGSTHRARHSFGTQLARSGNHLRVVQDLMRHASLATTQAYIAVDEDEKVAAIAGLGASRARGGVAG